VCLFFKIVHKLTNSNTEQIPRQCNKRHKHCVNITDSFTTDWFVTSDMNIQKNTYMKLWALFLSSILTPRKSKLITHGICTYRKNSGCFTHFLIMAFQNLMTCRNVHWVWNICFIFLEKLRLKTPVVLINIQHVLLAMRARTKAIIVNTVTDVRLYQHLNVSRCSKSAHYHIYGNPLSGSTVVMSHTESHGEADKLRTHIKIIHRDKKACF
jgi:hypothetical protein